MIRSEVGAMDLEDDEDAAYEDLPEECYEELLHACLDQVLREMDAEQYDEYERLEEEMINAQVESYLGMANAEEDCDQAEPMDLED